MIEAAKVPASGGNDGFGNMIDGFIVRCSTGPGCKRPEIRYPGTRAQLSQGLIVAGWTLEIGREFCPDCSAVRRKAGAK